MIMKVLITAAMIPTGSTVTKKTGEKPYIIRDDIKIWGAINAEQKDTMRELRADKGTRFMVADDGNINIIAEDTELLWHVDAMTLYHYMYEMTQLDHK
jgi:hypothetical protein